jgi:uncharacterized protein
MSNGNREFMRKFYEHMATANIAGILSSFHDEVEIHEPDCLPYGGVYRGIDGVKKLLSNASKHLDSRVFDVEVMLADGDRVISILHTATRGSRTRIHVAEDATIRDGKIHRVHVFLFDPTIIIKAAAEHDKT